MANYYMIQDYGTAMILPMVMLDETERTILFKHEDELSSRKRRIRKSVIDTPYGTMFTQFELAKQSLINNVKQEQERHRLCLKQLESKVNLISKLKE